METPPVAQQTNQTEPVLDEIPMPLGEDVVTDEPVDPVTPGDQDGGKKRARLERKLGRLERVQEFYEHLAATALGGADVEIEFLTTGHEREGKPEPQSLLQEGRRNRVEDLEKRFKPLLKEQEVINEATTRARERLLDTPKYLTSDYAEDDPRHEHQAKYKAGEISLKEFKHKMYDEVTDMYDAPTQEGEIEYGFKEYAANHKDISRGLPIKGLPKTKEMKRVDLQANMLTRGIKRNTVNGIAGRIRRYRINKLRSRLGIVPEEADVVTEDYETTLYPEMPKDPVKIVQDVMKLALFHEPHIDKVAIEGLTDERKAEIDEGHMGRVLVGALAPPELILNLTAEQRQDLYRTTVLRWEQMQPPEGEDEVSPKTPDIDSPQTYPEELRGSIFHEPFIDDSALESLSLEEINDLERNIRHGVVLTHKYAPQLLENLSPGEQHRLYLTAELRWEQRTGRAKKSEASKESAEDEAFPS